MFANTAAAIVTRFENLTDPRVERNRLHNLLEMIVVALCATICGADNWADVERFGKAKRTWLKRFLALENGIPSHDTFGRVFARLDTDEFLTCLTNWMCEMAQSLDGKTVAIDGKTLRRSFDRATDQAALHVVSAWAGELRLSLGQIAVDDKSNEIPAVPRLLELLELSGAVVTLDAMHCQSETATAIRNKDADYLLTVKGNQRDLHQTLLDHVDAWGQTNFQNVPSLRQYHTKEHSHGRLEHRSYYVAPAPLALKQAGRWPDVRSIGVVHRSRTQQGQTSNENTYFISSLPPKVKSLARHLRSHWGIENSLHWTLDVTFTEDDSRIRKGNGPELASVFRRLALSILKHDSSVKDSVRGKRLRAGWDEPLLEQILTGFQPV